MKIALVAQHATPLRPRAGGGPDSDDIGLSELTRGLAQHGHQVTVYAEKYQPDLPKAAELHDGVRVEHIDSGPIHADAEQAEVGLLERVPAFSGPLRSSWTLERPDVAHALSWTSGLAALAAARDLSIPVVQEFSSLGVTEPRERIVVAATSGPVPRTVAAASSGSISSRRSCTSSPLPGAAPGKPPAEITAEENLRPCSSCGQGGLLTFGAGSRRAWLPGTTTRKGRSLR
jgi:D-inositol-3-phosphate glycosyltransferase